jgi:predicted AlkP superfamily pyrophosphatase or phosphodiesterase
MKKSVQVLSLCAGLGMFLAGRGWAADYVIVVSVDGGGSSYIQSLVDAHQLPNFKRFQTEGVWTNNARADYDITVTLPNHVTQMTSRGILGAAGNGHWWTSNSDPTTGQTIHTSKGSYVASVFDVAHDNGLRTGVYATKTKFSLFDTSYNAVNGAPDTTGSDNGRDKLDVYQYNSSSPNLTNQFVAAMNVDPLNFALVHYTDGDSAGHSNGWGNNLYNEALKAVDGYLGQLFTLATTQPAMQGKTDIILTADHGGHGSGHDLASDPLNYTIPFYVWGPDALPGGDLYSLNALTRLNPGTSRPNYLAPLQPIRNGDAGNLALDLFGLGPIPGSTINAAQNLVIPEPHLISLMFIGCLTMMKRRSKQKVLSH